MTDTSPSTTADRTADQPPTEPEAQSTTPDSQSTGGQLSLGERRIDLATLLRIAGVGCLLAVGWFSAGPIGLAIGGGVAAVASSSPPVVAVALAQAGLLVVVPDLAGGRSLLTLASFEGGLVAILLSERPVDRPTVVLTVAIGAVFVVVVASAISWAGLAVASVAVVVLSAVMGYAIHRFERVSLGLASTETGASHE